MAKRQAIGNKVRFEVFRRDSFKCQYCGKSAPDVILNVDHINPASKGGTNDMFNLITSCFECNQGKKARKLDDENEVSKQKRQLDILNERRVQLDMLLEWKTGLIKNTNDQSTKIARYLIKKLGTKEFSISETGMTKIKAMLKKISPEKLIEIIDETIYQLSDSISYFGVTQKTFEIVFSIINAKYKAETSDKKSKVTYLMKQLDYHYNLNEKSICLIKEALENYLEEFNTASSFIALKTSLKELSAQEFYDSISI